MRQRLYAAPIPMVIRHRGETKGDTHRGAKGDTHRGAKGDTHVVQLKETPTRCTKEDTHEVQ